MARYIDADIVLPKIQYRERTYGCSKKMYSKVIKDTPTADVRPERHGKWIVEAPNAIGFFPVKCSNCGIKIATTGDPCDWVNEPDHLYCGACGAKMDGMENTNE